MNIKEYLDKIPLSTKIMGLLIIGIVLIVSIYIFYHNQQQTQATLLREAIERQNTIMEATQKRDKAREKEEEERHIMQMIELDRIRRGLNR